MQTLFKMMDKFSLFTNIFNLIKHLIKTNAFI